MSYIEDMIRRVAMDRGMDPDLAIAQAMQESSLNPNAVGGAGEAGLFQVGQGALSDYNQASGTNFGSRDLYDPETNANVGLGYLDMQKTRYGAPDMQTQLAQYNAGPGNPGAGMDYAHSVLGRTHGAAPPGFDSGADQPENWSLEEIMRRGTSSVTPSRVDAGSAGATAKTAENILLPGEPGGSLTDPRTREDQSTMASGARDIPTWQSALGILNPFNLLGIPLRTVGLLGDTIRGGLGLPTRDGATKDAADYITYGSKQGWQGFSDLPTDTLQLAQRVSDTRARGSSAPLAALSDFPTKLLNLATGDENEEQRQLFQAARQARGRMKGAEQQAKLAREQDLTTIADVEAQSAPGEAAAKAEKDRREAAAYPIDLRAKQVNIKKDLADIEDIPSKRSYRDAVTKRAEASLNPPVPTDTNLSGVPKTYGEAYQALRDKGWSHKDAMASARTLSTEGRVETHETGVESRAAQAQRFREKAFQLRSLGQANEAKTLEMAAAALEVGGSSYQATDERTFGGWLGGKPKIGVEKKPGTTEPTQESAPAAGGTAQGGVDYPAFAAKARSRNPKITDAEITQLWEQFRKAP